MLKYGYIIERLTDDQKIRLLSDIANLSRDEFCELGVPRVSIGEITGFDSDVYPSPESLAASFDGDLISRVAKEIYSDMRNEGVNVATVPSAKVKIDPYRAALSEDPYVSSFVASAYISAAKEYGQAVCTDGLLIAEDEAEWLDREPSREVIEEAVIAPFRDSAMAGDCIGVITDERKAAQSYKEVNTYLSNAIEANGAILRDAFELKKKVSPDDTVYNVVNKKICMSASSQALSAALVRYNKLKNSIAAGHASSGELAAEIEIGKAISPEMIDEAVDRLLDFAHRCASAKPSAADGYVADASLSARAASESLVLLKNDSRILPLSGGESVCLIGDVLSSLNGQDRDIEAFIRRARADGAQSVEFARGYDILKDRSDHLISEAVAAAAKADRVLVFLGFDRAREKKKVKHKKLTLPAGQLALLSALKAYHKKVIAIVSSSSAVDVSFDNRVEALIYAPINTHDGVIAAIDAAFGKIEPVGRLASTLYRNTEYSFAKQMAYRSDWGLSAGRFIGYRYYADADFDVGYPFGYGLSYTEFKYSDVSVSHDSVTFTVKNTGKRFGIETAQIYAGIKKSARLRPCRELVGFERIELFPGESRKVTVHFALPRIWDGSAGELVTEGGTYTVYVASSAKDVRLTADVRGGDRVLSPEEGNRNLSDYLQSQSNVINDKFTLEARYTVMKKSVKNIVYGIVAIALAIGIKVYGAATYDDSIFLTLVALALCAGAVVMFVLDLKDKNRTQELVRAEIDKINKKSFEDAEKMDVPNASAMFVDEFDSAERVNVAEAQTVHVEDNEFFMHIDRELSFKKACDDFEIFARERGYVFGSDAVREIFSALSASRLIMLKGMSNEAFFLFMTVLSEYFDSRAYIDAVDATYTNDESVLFGFDDMHHRTKKNVMHAIDDAKNTKHVIHFAGLTGVRFENISDYFVPFARYARNPLGSACVLATNENNVSTTYYIPQNLWFVVNLAPGETLDNIPDYISDIATVCSFELELKDPEETHTEIPLFKYYQLDYLCSKIKSLGDIDEDTWKKIDRLEEYVSERADYAIGNKRWIGLEKYLAAYIACEGDKTEAIDRAVASKILPSAIVALRNYEAAEDEKTVNEELDIIFGEENTYACRRMLQLAFDASSEAEDQEAEYTADGVDAEDGEQDNGNSVM